MLSPPDLDAALPVAHPAMDHAIQHVLRHHPARIQFKSDRDLVADIDLAVEQIIRDTLSSWHPDIGFLGEETGASGNPDTYWVLDPVDGTINLSHGSPLCAIALGLVHQHRPVLGVTALPFLNPARGTRYWPDHLPPTNG